MPASNPPTITSETIPQQLTGTSGDDTIVGGEGNDTISGGDGADSIHGGSGEDSLDGGAGNDFLDGGNDDDRVLGYAGDDTLHGGQGNDIVSSTTGHDALYGDDGDDYLFDNADNNTFDGGLGNDLLVTAGRGSNHLNGGDGNDTLKGGGGSDTLVGGAGNDTFEFYFGQSTSLKPRFYADGGDGDDSFQLRITIACDVQLTGGTGTDTYKLYGSSLGYTYQVMDFAAGDAGDRIDISDFVGTGATANPFSSPATLRLIQRDGDTVIQIDKDGAGTGYQFSDAIILKNVDSSALTAANFGGYAPPAQPGDPSAGLHLIGTDGADNLEGASGNDLIEGGLGPDSLIGNGGNDTLIGGGGDDQLVDSGGDNAFHGGDGDDYLNSTGSGASMLDGGEGNDSIFGGHGNDTLEGAAGNDSLALPRENQWIARSITMDGGAGDDSIFAGWINPADQITATGGIGKDTFTFWDLFGGSLRITDFDAGIGGDQLNLVGVWGTWAQQGNPFGATGYARVVQDGSHTLLQIDADGSAGSASAFKTIAVLENVQASSLTAENFLEGYTPHPAPETPPPTGETPPDPPLTASGSSGADTIEGGSGNDTLSGGAGDDSLNGNSGDDYIFGEDGSDRIVGGAGSDALAGGAGADSIEGGLGDDAIDGGAGLDTAIFGEAAASFTIDIRESQIIVARVSGTAETDFLNEVERIKFTDRSVACDVGADGIAGEVYRLYQAAFNRTPDQAGVGYWIAAADNGMALTQIAGQFMQSAEFNTLYGASTSNAELVRLLYVNALHRQPDEAGVAFWTNVLDTGGATRMEVLAAFSESAENLAAVATVIGDGFQFIPWP